MLIEQAIFTSAEMSRREGYQLVAHSPGIDEGDLRELSAWGPSHDSLLAAGDDAVSVNFFGLPSGCFCVSKTTPGGQEYSARGGPKVYTQCLVVDAEGLARFANNPFALLNAAFAQGSVRVHEKIPEALEAFRLAGRAAAVDQAALAQLRSEPGVTWLAALLEAAIASPAIAIVGGNHALRLVAGLFNALPVECRPHFSFSTGLKYSPRRPFRVLCLSDDPVEIRRLSRLGERTLLDLNGKPPQCFTTANGWGGLAANSIAAGRTEFLARQLAKPRPTLTLEQLPALGRQLLEQMAEDAPLAAVTPETPPLSAVTPTAAQPPSVVAAAAAAATDDRHRADAAHPRFQHTLQPKARSPLAEWSDDPSIAIGAQCPQALETLELLDDLVFESIAGKPGAFDELKALWPTALAQVGEALIEESREQYLRHALRVWQDCVEGDQIHNPALAVSTMDVICLLFNGP
ncbi:MAG TPA: hypothetical protein VFW87_20105 [Pirellulales bacterium]|nr:hypothetical protein [Pirellulales bacterium]